jgi:hypothetical protein
MRKSVCLVALLAFSIPVSLSASSKAHKKSFRIESTLQVQSVTLSPGNYELSWTTVGNNVPVTILHDGKPMVTVANASVLRQANPESGTYNVATNGALETAQGPNGTVLLTKVDFRDIAVILTPASVAR